LRTDAVHVEGLAKAMAVAGLKYYKESRIPSDLLGVSPTMGSIVNG